MLEPVHVWMWSNDPRTMVDLLRHRVSFRKLRWYAVSCVRRLLTSRLTKFHWDVVDDVEDAIDEGYQLPRPEWSVGPIVNALLTTNAFYAARRTTEVTTGDDEAERAEGRNLQLALLCDIFGNPFCPVALDSSWCASTVLALAEQMYESRDFTAMPILADALQDAGCESADVLAHCRSGGPHARGCWVVDLVLGKE